MNNPQRQILAALVATGIITTADGLANHNLSARQYIGLIFLAILLIMLASFAPTVAGPLAWLVFVAVLLTKGPNVLKKVKF